MYHCDWLTPKEIKDRLEHFKQENNKNLASSLIPVAPGQYWAVKGGKLYIVAFYYNALGWAYEQLYPNPLPNQTSRAILFSQSSYEAYKKVDFPLIPDTLVPSPQINKE